MNTLPETFNWNWSITEGELEFQITRRGQSVLEFQFKEMDVVADLAADVEKARHENDEEELEEWYEFLDTLESLAGRVRCALPYRGPLKRDGTR